MEDIAQIFIKWGTIFLWPVFIVFYIKDRRDIKKNRRLEKQKVYAMILESIYEVTKESSLQEAKAKILYQEGILKLYASDEVIDAFNEIKNATPSLDNDSLSQKIKIIEEEMSKDMQKYL